MLGWFPRSMLENSANSPVRGNGRDFFAASSIFRFSSSQSLCTQEETNMHMMRSLKCLQGHWIRLWFYYRNSGAMLKSAPFLVLVKLDSLNYLFGTTVWTTHLKLIIEYGQLFFSCIHPCTQTEFWTLVLLAKKSVLLNPDQKEGPQMKHRGCKNQTNPP